MIIVYSWTKFFIFKSPNPSLIKSIQYVVDSGQSIATPFVLEKGFRLRIKKHRNLHFENMPEGI